MDGEPEKLDLSNEVTKYYAIAEKGMYRCLSFYSLTDSAEYDHESFCASIKKPFGSILFPTKQIDEKTFSENFEQFTIWRTNCCLREAVEYFYNFLDGILILHHLIDQTKQGNTIFKKSDIHTKHKKDSRNDFKEKRKELKKIGEFDFTFLDTLSKIRNCISHHQGIPAEPEFQKAKGGVELAIPIGGNLVPYSLNDAGLEETKVLGKASSKNRKKIKKGARTIDARLQVEIQQRIIKVPYGEQFNFNREDLGGIIFYLRLQAETIKNALLSYAASE